MNKVTQTSLPAPSKNRKSHSVAKLLILALILFAFGLRLWQLEGVPPGWRDDELINSLVISQKVIDGNWTVYYADASGHEALYHIFNAFFLAVFGSSVLGIRLLSVFLGTLTIPLTYIVGCRLYNRHVGLVAAAALAVSFWSLMYSRTGIRHILTPVFALGVFYFFSKQQSKKFRLNTVRYALLTALFLGLGYYTYFASRGVPLILIAFAIYLWLFFRPFFWQRWRGIALALGFSLILALPLIQKLQQQPESEARVAELAVPIVEARSGNFEPLREHVVVTLSMFHSDGDDEWLYNIPHRPVFGTIGALFFWLGVLIAFWQALAPLLKRPYVAPRHSQAAALLLLWWLAGISPSFISVPPASLGHNIMAQSAVFLLAALPIWLVGEWLLKNWRLEIGDWRLSANLQSPISLLLGTLLVTTIALRDWPAYFQEWPQRGMVRFLYRADIHDVANYLNENPTLIDFGVTGLLAGPWDKLALTADLDTPTSVYPRWYNPQRALLLHPPHSFSGYPDVESPYLAAYQPLAEVAGGYELSEVAASLVEAEGVCFVNGLCWQTAVYDPITQRLELSWRVGAPLQLPDIPLISNPPPPGVYSGSRLRVFGQLHDANQNFLAGDDGLWVDPTTLQVDDIFLQQHWLALPDAALAETAVIGLYDPKTGARILTEDGRDLIRLSLKDIQKP